MSGAALMAARGQREASEAIVEVRGISKAFGGLQAVRGLSFQLRRGEILGIIGPNGAGKTTVFNMLSGFLVPDSGEILYEGTKVNGLKPNKIAAMGMVRTFQLVKPFGKMSVAENVMVGAFNRTSDPVKAWKAAWEALRFTGLDARAAIPAASLTIADKKRLEVARALAADPKVLLLDEVMAGLNPREVDQVVTIVRRIRDEKRISLIVIEHVMQALMALSDRVIVLHHGEKIAEGSPVAVSRDRSVIEAYLGEEWARC